MSLGHILSHSPWEDSSPHQETSLSSVHQTQSGFYPIEIMLNCIFIYLLVLKVGEYGLYFGLLSHFFAFCHL